MITSIEKRWLKKLNGAQAAMKMRARLIIAQTGKRCSTKLKSFEMKQLQLDFKHKRKERLQSRMRQKQNRSK